MKKYLFILLSISLSLCINSCKGDYMPEINQVNMPKFVLSDKSDVLISDDGFNGIFTIDLYYPQDVPQNSRVVIVRNDDVKTKFVYKDNVTSYPIDVNLTLDDLKKGFGELDLGDKVTIGVDLQYNNVWYDAFNETGYSTTSPDAEGLRGSNTSLSFRKACALDLDDFVGPVIINDPDFWEGEYEAEIVKISDTELQIVGFMEEDGPGTINIQIDTSNHSLFIPKQVFIKGEGLWGYHNFTFGDAKGTVDACKTSLEFSGPIDVDEGGFGTFSMTVTKIADNN